MATLDNKIYKIVKITHPNGEDRLDGRYPLRIGRKFRFYMNQVEIGNYAVLEYTPDYDDKYIGYLTTSMVRELRLDDNGNGVLITRNSLYYFEIVG